MATRLLDRLEQRCMPPRVQILEGQLLQLAVNLVQTQSMGNRCVNLQRFQGDAAGLDGSHRLHRAHIVQTVGQLDQDHAHIARHRQQHLAKRFGLRLLLG